MVTTPIFIEPRHVFHVGLCGHDKYARIADTLSTTDWDVGQEHKRKGDRSIDAPATRFGVIPYIPPRDAPSMNNESVFWWKLLPSCLLYTSDAADD